LHEDFLDQTKKLRQKFKTYKSISIMELRISEQMVSKMKTEMDKMDEECKTMRTVLETP